jgi:hypothetical protein
MTVTTLEGGSMSDQLDNARRQVDECWGVYENARGPLVAQAQELVRSLEGVTGLYPGGGADRLIDAIVNLCMFGHESIATMVGARVAALAAQLDVIELVALEPQPEPEPVPPPMLERDEDTIREWLKNADFADVADTLGQVLDPASRVVWARLLLGWCRSDGATAAMIGTLNAIIGDDDEVAE